MKTLQELLHIAAQTLPIWRDAMIAGLAFVVIGALLLAAELYAE